MILATFLYRSPPSLSVPRPDLTDISVHIKPSRIRNRHLFSMSSRTSSHGIGWICRTRASFTSISVIARTILCNRQIDSRFPDKYDAIDVHADWMSFPGERTPSHVEKDWGSGRKKLCEKEIPRRNFPHPNVKLVATERRRPSLCEGLRSSEQIVETFSYVQIR